MFFLRKIGFLYHQTQKKIVVEFLSRLWYNVTVRSACPAENTIRRRKNGQKIESRKNLGVDFGNPRWRHACLLLRYVCVACKRVRRGGGRPTDVLRMAYDWFCGAVGYHMRGGCIYFKRQGNKIKCRHKRCIAANGQQCRSHDWLHCQKERKG